MSISTLYTIKSIDYKPESGLLTSTVVLNPEHDIFRGHFPGNPILPGVCTLQIAKELFSEALQGNFRLSKASSIKYLGFVNPLLTPEMTYNYVIKPTDDETIHCSVTVTTATATISTFKAEYLRVGPV